MPGISGAMGDAVKALNNAIDNSIDNATDNAIDNAVAKSAGESIMDTAARIAAQSKIETPKIDLNIPKSVDNSIDNATIKAANNIITPKMDIDFTSTWKSLDDVTLEPFYRMGGTPIDRVRIANRVFDEVVAPMINKADPENLSFQFLKDRRYGMDTDFDALPDNVKNVANNVSRLFDEGKQFYETMTDSKIGNVKDYYHKAKQSSIDYMNNNDVSNIIQGTWDDDFSFENSFAYEDQGLIDYDEAVAHPDVLKRYILTSVASDTSVNKVAYQVQDAAADMGIDVRFEEAQETAGDIVRYNKEVETFNKGADEEVSKMAESVSDSDTVESAQKKASDTVDKIQKNADKIELPQSKKKFNLDSRKQVVDVGGMSRYFKTGIERAKNITFIGYGENAGKTLNLYDDGGFKQYRWADAYGRALFQDMIENGAIDKASMTIDPSAVSDMIVEATSQKYMPTLVQSLRTGKSASGGKVTTVQAGLTKKLSEIASDTTLNLVEKQSQMTDAITNMYKMTARSQVKWNIMLRLQPKNKATAEFLQRYFNRMQIQDAVNTSVMSRLSNAFLNMRSAGLLGLNFRASVQNISETSRLLYWYGPKIRTQAMAQTPQQMFDILEKYGMLDKMVNFKGTKDDILGAFESIIGGTSDLARVPFTYTEMYKNAVFLKGAELKNSGLSGRELTEAVANDFERLSIASGFMSSLGMADTDFGRLATMFYQYPIKEINYTLGSVGKIWKETDNKALALGKEGLFTLAWLAPKAAYYLAMNWAGVSLSQSFSIFDPFGQIEDSYDGISDEDRIFLDDLVSVLPLSAALTPLRTLYFQSRKNGIADAEAVTGSEDPVTGERTATGFVMGSPFGRETTTEAIRSLPGGGELKRVADAIRVLDAGGSFSQYTGDLQYEAPEDPLEILNMFVNGRSAIRSAQNYFGNANPYKGIAESVQEGNLAPLGAELSKDALVEAVTGNKDNSMSSFAPYDNEYSGQFDGSYNDKYTFRDAINQIKQRKKEIVGGDDDNYSLRSLYKQLLYEQNKREKELNPEPTEKEKSLQERIDSLEGEIIDDLQNLANAYMAAGHQITATEQNSMLQILDFEQSDSSNWDYLTERRNKYVEAGLPEDVTASTGESLSMQYARDKYYGASADMEDDIKKVFSGKTVNGKILPSISPIKQNYSDQFFALQKQGKYDEAGAILQEYIQQYFMPRVDILAEKYGAYELTSSANAMEELANYLFAVPSDYTRDNNGRYFSAKKYSGKTSALKAFAETYIKDLYGNGAENTWAADTSDAQARALINEINYSLDDGEVASAKVKARRLINDMNNGKIKLSNTDVKFLNLVLNMD